MQTVVEEQQVIALLQLLITKEVLLVLEVLEEQDMEVALTLLWQQLKAPSIEVVVEVVEPMVHLVLLE